MKEQPTNAFCDYIVKAIKAASGETDEVLSQHPRGIKAIDHPAVHTRQAIARALRYQGASIEQISAAIGLTHSGANNLTSKSRQNLKATALLNAAQLTGSPPNGWITHASPSSIPDRELQDYSDQIRDFGEWCDSSGMNFRREMMKAMKAHKGVER